MSESNSVLPESTTESSKLVWGLLGEKVLNIKDVDSGLACGCNCPHCGSQLIARKGEKNIHHFAHYNADECDLATETALHLLAKELLLESRFIQLPCLKASASEIDRNGTRHEVQSFRDRTITGLRDLKAEVSQVDYRPDLSGFTNHGIPLDIEIKVTHAVDEDKKLKAMTAYRDMIEIDLSQINRMESRADVRDAVLFTAPRQYIFSATQQLMFTEVRQSVIEKQKSANNLLDKVESQSPVNTDLWNSPTDLNTITAIGFKIGEGYSAETQQDFHIAHLYYLKNVQTGSTTNFSVHCSGGFEVKCANVALNLTKDLEKFGFPIQLKVNFEHAPGYTHVNRKLITSFVPLL
jgi:hypothetical protein